MIISKYAENKMENFRDHSLKMSSSQELNTNSWRVDPRLLVSFILLYNFSMLSQMYPVN